MADIDRRDATEGVEINNIDSNAESGISIYGSKYDDTIRNDGVDVTIDAGNGNDSIISDGSDGKGASAVINAGAGNDTIHIGNLNVVSGGIGSDLFVYTVGKGHATINDYSAYQDNDIIQVSGNTDAFEGLVESGDDYIVKAGSYDLTLKNAKRNAASLRFRLNDYDSINSAVSDLNMDASERVAIINTSGARVTIKGSADDDTIKASGNNVSISAGNGDNIVAVTGTNSTINAGDGNDSISATAASASINAGAGNNTISAGTGATVQAGSGNDVVTIADNSTYIYSGGNDTLNGYTNKSRIKLNGSNFAQFSGKADSSTGLVTITFSDTSKAVSGTLVMSSAAGKVINIVQNNGNVVGPIYTGNGGEINTQYNAASNQVVNGSDGDNYIVSSGSNNTIKPGAGNDTVELLHSTDDSGSFINYTEGNDIVIGFDTIDAVRLDYASSTPTIGAFYSGNDLQVLDGTDTSTVLTIKDVKTKTVNVTREGDNTATALNGNVTLQGVTNRDVFYYKAGSGNQTIVGYDGYDSIVTSTDTSVTNAAIKSNNVILAIGTSSLTVKDGASDKLNIAGYGSQQYGDKNIEVENGDGDTINATLNASVVTVDGAESRTTSVYLIGNKNNNRILGTKKVSSTLHGGTGNDTLTGGEKADVFIYSAGKDVITDYFGKVGDLSSTIDAARYETDTDVIQLSTGSISTYSISGQDVVFTIDGDKNKTLTVKDGKNKKITFYNASGDVDTGTTKIYRSSTEYIVTADDIGTIPASLKSDVDGIVTVTAADSKVTLIDANLELNNNTGTSLANTNLYISGNSTIANTLKASRYGKDTLIGGTKADTLVGSGTLEGVDTGADTFLYKYGMGKDVIVNYKEADQIYFTSTDTTLTGSTLKGGNVTFTVTDLKGKNKSTFVVRDVADKKITFANEDGKLYSQVFGTTAITVSNEDEATVNTKPNTAVKTIDASNRTDTVYILGNAKANSIKAGKGDTTLQGGTGNDTLDGGTEAVKVTFAFGSNEGTANVINNYTFNSDTIKVLSGAHTATATIKNSNDLTFTIGKTKVRLKDAKEKAVTFVDVNGNETTQVFGTNKITVENKDATENATVNTAANSTVVTIDAAARTDVVYLAGNSKANVIVTGKGDETVATAGGKDTVAITDLVNDQHIIITDYVAGTDKIRLGNGISITHADTIKANGTIQSSNGNATLAADTVVLTLASDTGNASSITAYLAIEGAITTKKGKTTHGKITVIDDTKGITYSQAYSSPELVVGNSDGATVDTSGNTIATMVNAKKRTSKVAIIGNEKINSIVGGTKADTIYAGITSGSITINGAGGADSIIGTLDDSVTSVYALGGAGADTIVAGLGKNTISGGKGNDVFVYEVQAGKGNQGGEDTIIDFTTGTNKLWLESGTTLAATSVSGSSTYLTLQGASANDTKKITLSNLNGKKVTIYDGTTGITTKQAYGVESIAVANGDAGTIDASASYNSNLKTINAKKVTKSIYLIGNDNDGSRIIGGTKADTIKSGKGNTSITGGAGNDVFIYGGGADTITDYSVTSKNNDVLQFAAGNPTYYHVEGKNVVLEFSDTKTVTTNTLTIVNGKDKKFNYNGWTPSTTSFGSLDPTFDGTFDDYTQLVLTKATTVGEVKSGTNSLDYRTTYINASKNNGPITIWGNDSDSTIVASAKADNIKGGSEDDLITTGKGKDTISISGGNDTITDYAVGSDVIHLNGYALKSATTKNGTDVIFTVVDGSNNESTLRVQNAVNKKGVMQKITIYDDATGHMTSQVYGTNQNSLVVAGTDGDTINLDTDINSGVRNVDASKRTKKQGIYIKGNAQNNSLKGGAGSDTLIGNGGNDQLIGGAGDDSLVGSSTGTTTFDPGKGDDTIVISTAEGRGKATITYTAGGDKIQNYKHTDTITLATSTKVTSATKRGDTYTLNFKNGGTLDITLASGEQSSDTFKVGASATQIAKSATRGEGADSVTTYYNYQVKCYVDVSNIKGAVYSTTTIKAASASIATSTALGKSFEERYFDDEVTVELFDDTVLSGTDDLSEVTASTVDKAAIAVDLTTNSLTDFKVDSESLTTITQNDKDKK